jgi:hypothetical protein
MVMAMRLLEMQPQKPGSVVECGCYKGGASVNLSLVCRIVGRRFKIYDSFEGLPPVSEGDYVAEDAFKDGFIPGIYEGKLEEVKKNIEQYGAIDVCQFHKGWFENTLPKHKGKIALVFIDVDFCSSLHDCLLNLWPNMTNRGFLYMDEYRAVPYCSVFYSEKYWDKYFNEDPPGLIGIGTGVQVGNFFTSPGKGKGLGGGPSLNSPQSVAFTMKGSRAKWDYYPDEILSNGEEIDVVKESA